MKIKQVIAKLYSQFLVVVETLFYALVSTNVFHITYATLCIFGAVPRRTLSTTYIGSVIISRPVCM